MIESPQTLRLVFDDFVDLQTRLILLPRIEEEAVEAVVAMYTPKNDNVDSVKSSSSTKPESNEQPESKEGAGEAREPTERDASNQEPGATSKTEQQNEDPPEEKPEKSEEQPEEPTGEKSHTDVEIQEGSCNDIDENGAVGMVLTGIATDESDKSYFDDCGGKDFTSILATIREAPTPIVLVFQRIAVEQDHAGIVKIESSKEKENVPEDDASTSTSATPEECDVDDVSSKQSMKQSHASLKQSTPRGSEWSDRFSSWGSKVRATSATLAAEAASSAAILVAAANEVAAERVKSNRLASATLDTAEPLADGARCSLFVQCSGGQFVPLRQQTSPPPKVTTSSILLVRESAKEPCPSRGYHFQWYRSYRPASVSDGSVSETSSKDGSKDGSNDGTAEDASVASVSDLEWTALPGAIYAAYQPSATDVGHYLRCVVTIDSLDGCHNENTDDSHCEEDEETAICTTNCIISADIALFSGATQALTRGAKFGNIAGRGNAEGRLFRLHVEIARCTDEETNKADVTSSVTVFQISGNTTEPLHDEPILHVTAVSDPSRPKDFDLILPENAPSLVSALSENGHFQLQAPNRITRESLLLALGIANYKGKPAKLNIQTALYPGRREDVTGSLVEGTDETPVKQPLGDEVEFFTPQENSCPTPDDRKSDASTSDRTKQLEREFQRSRSKMARKDKVIADLQRQLTQSDTRVERMEKALAAGRAEADSRKKEIQDCRSLLRAADRRNDAHNDTIKRLKGDHAAHVASLEDRLSSQSEKIADLEKTVRILQNEKAVLSAAVEARDSKLSKMGDLQTAVEKLSQKVSKGDSLKTELNEMNQRYIEITQEMEKVSNFEKECREELEQTRSTMEDLQKRLAEEKQQGKARQSQLERLQVKNQKLHAERNNYKQKADSLSKEVGRLCRNGRTLRDVEKIIADEEARQMEVSLLKQQKRQALEDLHHYRTAYEQTIVAQKNAGLDGEAVRALEQKAELERVISDMTEYVNAKEMQLETLKEVNQALQEELHMLARANMSKNDI